MIRLSIGILNVWNYILLESHLSVMRGRVTVRIYGSNIEKIELDTHCGILFVYAWTEASSRFAKVKYT